MLLPPGAHHPAEAVWEPQGGLGLGWQHCHSVLSQLNPTAQSELCCRYFKTGFCFKHSHTKMKKKKVNFVFSVAGITWYKLTGILKSILQDLGGGTHLPTEKQNLKSLRALQIIFCF